MMFVDDPEFTRYGYYQVNGIKTFSKFEAWEQSGKEFDKIEFIYNPDELSKHNWTKEPEEDIYTLYARRAMQLREKYDYIVLMYSGGIDCTTVLDAFLNNGIHLDEICSCSNITAEPETGLFNQEIFAKAIPTATSLNLKELGTVFRHVDITDMMRNQYSNEFHFNNFQYYMNTTGNNWSAAVKTFILKSHIADHMKLAEKGKKICYLWGLDKPTVKLNDGHYASVITDIGIDFVAKNYVNRVLLKDRFENFYDEPFYNSRECPELIIKQGHLLVNYINSVDPTDPRLLSQDDLNNTGPIVIHHRFEYFRFLSKKMVDGAIYPSANLDLFGNDKVKGSVILTVRDNWFNKSDHPNRYKWEEKFNDLLSNNRDLYHFKDDLVIQAKAILNKPYNLQPIKFKQ